MGKWMVYGGWQDGCFGVHRVYSEYVFGDGKILQNSRTLDELEEGDTNSNN